MKRFWFVLVTLGLLTAFSTSAFAVDVKFSGEYYAAGMYLDKIKVTDESATGNQSTAFYYQRLRVRTDFIVSPGLTLVTRFDALERAWGAPRNTTSVMKDSAGTDAENENIAFDWAYINYKSPIGTFDVGYMNDGSTGTIFGNSYAPAGRIKYSLPIGAFTLNAAITKVLEKSSTAKNPVTYTDADNDKYSIEGVYSWKDGKAGVQVAYYRYAEKKPVPADLYTKTYFLLTPYAIAKIGPVSLQAELNYATGKAKEYEASVATPDRKLENISGWVDATADFDSIYFGGSFAYVSGDDPNTANKEEGGTINGGRDWNPCLIMFNYYDRAYWVGPLAGYGVASDAGTMGAAASTTTSTFPGAWFGQGRIGVRPIAALDIMASLSYASADEKPAGVLNNDYGWELDLTGTYKITNNLSYMLGFGYLLTGDYYKGSSNANSVEDNFMVINKLTLTF